MDEHIFGFPPVIGLNPQILILGTMPSVLSLRANEYYAHPGNAFWKIVSAIKGLDCPANYEEKKQLILDMNLALWDVCHTCIRPGSADNDIRDEAPNPIRSLLETHPSIHTIIFNGKTAEKLFHRHFKTIDGITTIALPSTSPAYTLSFEKKLSTWRTSIQYETFIQTFDSNFNK